MDDKYKDILYLPHKQSETRPHMPIADRAAQFSPFAALTGHDAAIRETARLTDKRLELSEEAKEKLNQKLLVVVENAGLEIPVAITYFVPDGKKPGGRYITKTGLIKRLDGYGRTVVFQDMTAISIDEISEIESELFRE